MPLERWYAVLKLCRAHNDFTAGQNSTANIKSNNKAVVNKLKLWRPVAKFSDEDAQRDGRLQIAEPQKVEQIRIHKPRTTNGGSLYRDSAASLVNEKLHLGEVRKLRWDRTQSAFSQRFEDVRGNSNENIKNATKTLWENS